MKKVQNIAAFVFISAVTVLSLISVLGVWDFFSHDTITKSFETLGLLALVTLIVMVAGRFMESRNQQDPAMIIVPNPIFKDLRRVTLVVLIICVSVLALLGVCAIWNIITDKDVLYKSLASVAILAFGAFVIVMTCLDREDNPMFKRKGGYSIGAIIGILFIVYLLISTLFSASRLFH